MNENPYQAPVSVAQPPPLQHSADAGAVAIREAHIVHEASVKGLGLLQIIVGALMSLGGVGMLAIGVVSTEGAQFLIAGAIFYLAFGLLGIFTGLSLRGLRVWARVVTIIFASLGLLSGIIGVIMPPHWFALLPLAINGYVFALMISAKSRMVFSDDYKQIIAVTPWIRYRSKLLWILLVILGLFILVIIALAALNVKTPH